MEEIQHTTIKYTTSGLIDAQIMESLAAALHPNSGKTPVQVMNVLDELAKKKAA